VADAAAAKSRAADLGLVLEYRAGEGGWRRESSLACCAGRFEDALSVRPFHFEKGLGSFAGWWSFVTTATARCCPGVPHHPFDRLSESGPEQAMREVSGIPDLGTALPANVRAARSRHARCRGCGPSSPPASPASISTCRPGVVVGDASGRRAGYSVVPWMI